MQLKYKLIRVGIDSISIAIVEEQSALLVETERLRLSMCNAHNGTMCPNMIVDLPDASVSQPNLLNKAKIFIVTIKFYR